MIGIGLGLRLLGVMGKIRRGVLWCFATPYRALVSGLLLALAIALFRLWRLDAERDDWRSAARDYESAYLAWQGAFHKLVVDVELGRVEAAKLDRENADRVSAELETIKRETADDYDKALADTRAAAERLRRQLAQAATEDRSGGGTAAMPGDYSARCAAFGYADCDTLLAALPGLLTAAEENTAKLIALQAWVKAMLAIDLNGEEA